MSDANESRLLRLERLEVRTLLAGGIFQFGETVEHVADQQSRSDVTSDSSSTPAEVSSARGIQRGAERGREQSGVDSRGDAAQRDGARPDQLRSNDSRGNDLDLAGGRDPIRRDSDRRDPVNRRQSRDNEPNRADQQSPMTSAQSNASGESFSPSNSSKTSLGGSSPSSNSSSNNTNFNATVSTGNSSGSNFTSGGNVGGDFLVQQSNPRAVVAIDAAISSLTSVSSEQTTVESAADSVQPVSTIEPESDGFVVESETIESGEEGGLLLASDNEAREHDHGLLQWVPLWGFGQSHQDGQNVQNEWELSRDTLPLLKRVIEASPDERIEIADELMAGWFSGPGGMIALDRVLLPSPKFAIENLSIDVQLESAVMLHRSFGMVASGVVPPLSGPVLDAIMASLEEAASSQNQPVGVTAVPRLPTAAYPAIVAITTGIAIAARRQFKHPSPEPQTVPRS
ncbi:hypothetical protein [Rhodopirellula sp. SWK7]|uniref:hypothetical protein n=1 Tax=Rhodopirellula sp. SWK7 TaxID=595460 RepID=UPI0002BD2C5A|nr:hypothetical protein [Rhodopirellula sp. SWK7]EMI46510.1 hypothetical protein RRSWK_00990 [Rhodopirellula sp. SWK7]